MFKGGFWGGKFWAGGFWGGGGSGGGSGDAIYRRRYWMVRTGRRA